MSTTLTSFAQTAEQDRLVAIFTKRFDALLSFSAGTEPSPFMLETFAELALDPVFDGNVGEQLREAKRLLGDRDKLRQAVLERLYAKQDLLDDEIDRLEKNPLKTQLQRKRLAEMKEELELTRQESAPWRSDATFGPSDAALLAEALDLAGFANAYYRQTLRLAVRAASSDNPAVPIRKGLQALLSVRGFEQSL